jgi:DNA-binding GntR family transcriptional regulator
VDAYWAANRNFHQFIAESAANQRLLNLIENHRRQILKTRVISMRYPERLEDSMAEHEDILGAILAGEGRKAESLVIGHLEKQREFVLELIRDTNDNPKDPA